MTKLFDLIKEDLGESQSANFKLFYDLMSNQIKYCLSSYIENDKDEENKEQKESKPIISPMVLLNLI